MIDHKHKCIFVHIPKCAGASIRRTLGGPNSESYDSKRNIHIDHATASELKAYYTNGEFEEYFKFSIVRNPFDRMVSAYFYYIKRTGVRGSFYEFVTKTGIYQEVLQKNPSSAISSVLINIRPAYDYLYDLEGNLLVDFVGRFEDLQRSWAKITRKLKVDYLLTEHLNQSRRKPYQIYYTQRVRSLVSSRFENDLKVFGYGY